MEHDDPPRRPQVEGRFREAIEIGREPATGRPPRSGERLRRLVPAAGGRLLGSRRGALLGAAACAGLAVTVLLVGSLGRGLLTYVHSRDEYRLSTRDVTLDPPPPPWYRGGSRAFLDRVWDQTTEPRTFSSLDLDHHRLNLIFRRNPWVERVLRIETGYPNRVVARVAYREPVALAKLDDGSKILLDRDGVMLPPDDVDLDGLEVVGLAKFGPPRQLRHGEVWDGGDPESRRRLSAAARLAGFIQARRRTLDSALPGTYYLVLQPFSDRGFYVQITGGKTVADGDSLMFLWQVSTPDRPAPVPDDAQRWSMLCEWVKDHPPGQSGRVIHLNFTPRGVEPDPTPIARKSDRKGS